jgi:hypothetical protein
MRFARPFALISKIGALASLRGKAQAARVKIDKEAAERRAVIESLFGGDGTGEPDAIPLDGGVTDA